MNLVRRFVRTPWRRQVEYVTILCLALVCELLLRMHVRLERIAWLFGVQLGHDQAEPQQERSDDVALPRWAVHRLRMVRTVLRRWPVDGECLRLSIVAGQRLRSLRPTLRIGVTKVNGSVAAHSWLEVRGHSLDPASAAYLDLGALL